MKMKYLIPTLFSAFTMQVLADDCSVTVDSNDAMKFDKTKLSSINLARNLLLT